ncbi:MAG: NAD+ synthase, partial [Oricola sp.]|nr:NAD+ synthase [Oricola sp.]
MTETLAIALCQIEPLVGDIDGNVSRILKARAEVAAKGADLAIFCELVVSGYPPEDLVQKPAYQRACMAAVERLAKETADGGPAMIVGSPWRAGDALHNSAFLLTDGKIAARRDKVRLP